MGLRRGRHRDGRRGWPSLVLGVGCVAAAVALIGNVVYYEHHSTSAGRSLVRSLQRDLAKAAASPSPGCAQLPASGSRGRAYGVLDIPALGLTAPVLQGVDETQLSVAVGHLPTSVLPGQPGTSVLAAHDVTWFSHIDHLHAGDLVLFRHGCAVDTYRVAAHRVVDKGSPLSNARTPQIVLETCWPTTALYWTNQRYLVFADFVSRRAAGTSVDVPVADGLPDLVSPGVEALAEHSFGAPMGTLTFAGSPTAAWRQSDFPLALAHAAKANYLAGLQAVADDSAAEWAVVAGGRVARPHLAYPGGGAVTGYRSTLDIVATVRGDVVTSVRTHAVVQLAGQGSYDISTVQSSAGGRLALTGWSMSPLSAAPSSAPTRTAAATTAAAPAAAPVRAASSSPTPTRSPSPSPSPTRSASATPTESPSPTPTATAS